MKYFSFLFLTLLSLCSANVFANEKNVVLHINEREKFTLMVNTIKFIKENNKEVNFYVIVNGPAVQRLSKRYSSAKELLDMAIPIGACSLGLFNNRMAREDLTEGVEFLSESGIVKLMELQEKGYAYIKI